MICTYTGSGQEVGTALVVRRLLFVVAVVVALISVDRPAFGQTMTFVGRSLPDALRVLQTRGLKLVFSSELVRDDMRVVVEPSAKNPRKILDEILKPHGLEAKSGPADVLFVVRTRRTTDSAAKAAPSTPLATGQIKGTVVDARTGVALPGVSVGIQGQTTRIVTDDSGAFVLTDVPAEPQPLIATLVGYGLARPLVNVSANETTTIVIPLADGTSTYTERVTVAADPFRSPGSAVPGEQSLTSADLMNTRGVLTDDPFRAVQALPGVATGNDFRSDFTIRGSDARHLALTVDGIETPWPLHVVRDHESDGSIALINGDILDHVTVAPGLYPQQHAGHTGGWVDFSLREGSRADTMFHGSVGSTSASFVAEGPLGSSRRGSWLASARQSYVQWLISRIDSDGGTAFGFSDAQFKTVYDITSSQQLQITAVVGRSRLEDTNVHTDPNTIKNGTSHTGIVVAGWRSTHGTSLVITNRAAFSANTFRNKGLNVPSLGDGSSGRMSYRGQVSWSASAKWLVEAGVLVDRDRDDSTFTRFIQTSPTALGGNQVERINGSAWTTSGDVRAAWTGTGTQAIDVGVLVTHSGLTGETKAAPWIIAAQPIGAQLTLRGAAGLRQQRPQLQQVIGSFGQRDATMERASAFEAGAEYRPKATVRVELVAYNREERNILRLEDNEARLVNGQVVFPSVTPYWLNALSGTSRGVELSVQRRAAKGFSGWLSYAYGRTRYTDTTRAESYWSEADQRHTFNGYAEYRTSPNTSFGVKLRLGSNMPIPGYLEERGGEFFVSDQRNAVRLPRYSRLDLRANHAFNYTKRRLTLFVELINVTGHTNWGAAGDVFIQRNGGVLGYVEKLFPFLPSAGILIDF